MTQPHWPALGLVQYEMNSVAHNDFYCNDVFPISESRMYNDKQFINDQHLGSFGPIDFSARALPKKLHLPKHTWPLLRFRGCYLYTVDIFKFSCCLWKKQTMASDGIWTHNFQRSMYHFEPDGQSSLPECFGDPKEYKKEQSKQFIKLYIYIIAVQIYIMNWTIKETKFLLWEEKLKVPLPRQKLPIRPWQWKRKKQTVKGNQLLTKEGLLHTQRLPQLNWSTSGNRLCREKCRRIKMPQDLRFFSVSIRLDFFQVSKEKTFPRKEEEDKKSTPKFPKEWDERKVLITSASSSSSLPSASSSSMMSSMMSSSSSRQWSEKDF